MNNRTVSRPLRTAHIDGAHAAQALTIVLRSAMWCLIALSAIGTLYGVLGQAVPLWQPWRIIGDVIAAPAQAALALALQLGLTLGQWGGIELAREDRRWWIVYVGALLASVALNVAAYWEPLVVIAGLPWLVAIVLIIGGDVTPEWLLKK
jgi:hypothetical protein